MKIAALQIDIAWEDPQRNMARAARALDEAAALGARLAVLPEMFSTGFSMKAERVAEPPDGPVYQFLSEAARSRGMFVLGTRAERVPGTPHPQNTAYLFGPDGSMLLRYAKVHPFSFAGEHLHFTAGNELPTARLDEFTLAACICYDVRFPEIFRALCLRGADLFVVPANWPSTRTHHWSHLLQARAIENQAFVVGVNRVGSGGGLDYAGRSAIIDPTGALLAEGRDDEAVLTADVDPDAVKRTRSQFPFLRDFRADLFPGLTGPPGPQR